MAYKLTYDVRVDWVGPSVGINNGQTMLFKHVPRQSGRSQTATFLAADITALMRALSEDVTAQMTANMTRIQNWANGGD